MFPIIINPLPLLIVLSTAFGVLFHDTQVDAATKRFLSVPVTIVAYANTDMSIKMNDPHIHTVDGSYILGGSQLKGDQPRTQTRNDDKKYVTQKRSSLQDYGSEYIWPSI